MSNEPRRSRPEADRPPKTVLICPECGHESPVGGDWIEDDPTADESRRRYACPECGAVITRRPAGGAD